MNPVTYPPIPPSVALPGKSILKRPLPPPSYIDERLHETIMRSLKSAYDSLCPEWEEQRLETEIKETKTKLDKLETTLIKRRSTPRPRELASTT